MFVKHFSNYILKMSWDNGTETSELSYEKRIASPSSMHDTGC